MRVNAELRWCTSYLNGAISASGKDVQKFPRCAMRLDHVTFSLRLPSTARTGPWRVVNKELLKAMASRGNHSENNCISKSPSSMAPRAAVFHVLAMCWLVHGPVLRGRV